MIVLKIENIKEFMGHLFRGGIFDLFHVGSCEVTTFVTFQTDGKRHDAWYDTDEKPVDATGLVTWQQLKPIIFELIKGTKAPERMRIDFCHYREHGDVGSIRIEYEKDNLHLFTGYMQKEFSLSKEAQLSWDESCRKFLQKHQIVSTQLN